MVELGMAKARISLRDGTFEFDGTIEFVAQQLERYQNLIETVLTKKANFDVPADNGVSDPTPAPKIATVSQSANVTSDHDTADSVAFQRHFGVSKDQLDHVIHLGDDGSIKILAGLKGLTTADMQRKVCLLYCLAKDFMNSGQAIAAEELRQTCRYHSCFDPNNFSRYFRDSNHYISDGKGSNNTYKLTAPGKDEARRLIGTLVSFGA